MAYIFKKALIAIVICVVLIGLWFVGNLDLMHEETHVANAKAKAAVMFVFILLFLVLLDEIDKLRKKK
jgi:hypothetical protein